MGGIYPEIVLLVVPPPASTGLGLDRYNNLPSVVIMRQGWHENQDAPALWRGFNRLPVAHQATSVPGNIVKR